MINCTSITCLRKLAASVYRMAIMLLTARSMLSLKDPCDTTLFFWTAGDLIEFFCKTNFNRRDRKGIGILVDKNIGISFCSNSSSCGCSAVPLYFDWKKLAKLVKIICNRRNHQEVSGEDHLMGNLLKHYPTLDITWFLHWIGLYTSLQCNFQVPFNHFWTVIVHFYFIFFLVILQLQ